MKAGLGSFSSAGTTARHAPPWRPCSYRSRGPVAGASAFDGEIEARRSAGSPWSRDRPAARENIVSLARPAGVQHLADGSGWGWPGCWPAPRVVVNKAPAIEVQGVALHGVGLGRPVTRRLFCSQHRRCPALLLAWAVQRLSAPCVPNREIREQVFPQANVVISLAHFGGARMGCRTRRRDGRQSDKQCGMLAPVQPSRARNLFRMAQTGHPPTDGPQTGECAGVAPQNETTAVAVPWDSNPVLAERDVWYRRWGLTGRHCAAKPRKVGSITPRQMPPERAGDRCGVPLTTN